MEAKNNEEFNINGEKTFASVYVCYYYSLNHYFTAPIDEEIFFEHNNTSPEDDEFDAIIGCLEELLQEESFQALLNGFYQEHCGN